MSPTPIPKEPISAAVANHFVHSSAALRYAAGRPYFHPLVVEKIAAFTQISRFSRALDVGCGTGQSTTAIATLATEVEALDISPEMIAAAPPQERVRYQVAAAENLPFPDSYFDLVTAGLAFHWFDQIAFLREAFRVLQPGGWLAIYNHGITGEMVEDAEFRKWAREAYRQRFPTPARHASGVTPEVVAPLGFELAGSEEFGNQEIWTEEQFVAFLLTQSNIIAVVESGTMPLAPVASWISESVRPYFQGERRTMLFAGKLWYLRRRM